MPVTVHEGPHAKRENLTRCPECSGPLKVIAFPFSRDTRSYCPKDDIARTHYMSFPYLCKDCDSDQFYTKNPKEKDALHRKATEIYDLLYGFDIEEKKWAKKDTYSENLMLMFKNINDKLSTMNTCWFCGSHSFYSPDVKELERMNKEGSMKDGWKLSKEWPEDACEHKSVEWVEKHNEKILKTECSKCGEDMYVFMNDVEAAPNERILWSNLKFRLRSDYSNPESLT